MNKTQYYINSFKYLLNRWVRQKKYLVAGVPAYGLKIKCKTVDYIGRHIYKRGIYEPALSLFLNQEFQFKAGDIFLDVGANIGWHSLLLAKNNPALQVFAFEPEPENFELLQENIRLNRLPGIEAIPSAVSDREGEQTFHLYADKNAGRHSLLPIHEGEKITVPLTTLDRFLEARQLSPERVKLMKIDVEGYELHVLRGAASLLETVPVILSEFSPSYMQKGKIDPKDLISLLEQYEYQPHQLNETGLQPISSSQLMTLPPDMDIFWIKKGPSIHLAST